VLYNLNLWAANKKPVPVLEVTVRVSPTRYESFTQFTWHVLPSKSLAATFACIFYHSYLLNLSLFSLSSFGISREVQGLESIALPAISNEQYCASSSSKLKLDLHIEVDCAKGKK